MYIFTLLVFLVHLETSLCIMSIGRTVIIAEPSVRPILSSVPMCRASSEIQWAYLPDDGFSALIVFPRPMQYARQQVIESLEPN